MDDQALEMKRKMMGELKQFARSEMARDLGKRHGRTMRLPWDPDEAPAAEPKEDELDNEALQALAAHLGD